MGGKVNEYPGSRRTAGFSGPAGRIIVAMKRSRAATRRHLPGSPFNAPAEAPPVEVFALDDRVTHDKYGLGRVIGVEEDVAVLVDFGSRTERITAPYNKLFKL
jgi:hypothetical protein